MARYILHSEAHSFNSKALINVSIILLLDGRLQHFILDDYYILCIKDIKLYIHNNFYESIRRFPVAYFFCHQNINDTKTVIILGTTY
jgi:hypothetical protein